MKDSNPTKIPSPGASEPSVVTDDERRFEDLRQESKRLEAIGTMAGGIAHDFNNLLTTILWSGRLIEQQTDAGHPIARDLRRLLDAADRGRSLVEQILTFSRRRDHNLVPVDLGRILSESLDFLRPSLPKGVALRERGPAYLPPILGDPTQIQQVIINLCTNAAQAIGENRTGTVEIATDIAVLSAEDAQRRGLSTPGDYVRFVVRDDGAGMSPEVRERIFDPFFTTKQLGIGTGLGLSVVHGIVRGHGGSIDVRSAPGEGATFEILWPMATNTVDSKQAPTQDASPSGSEHILWIDDDAAVLEAGQELLHRLGYRVTSSRDAQEAWSAFAASPADFDLVISDQMMPKMRGDELAEKIGSVRPDARMILLTGYFNILPRRSDGPTPIRKILMKPIDPAELAAAIRAALDD